jgi:hypothetical protein
MSLSKTMDITEFDNIFDVELAVYETPQLVLTIFTPVFH